MPRAHYCEARRGGDSNSTNGGGGMTFIKNYFRILRAMFALHILRKYTLPEYIPLITYGRFVAHVGDVAVINNIEGDFELGEVTEVTAGKESVPPMLTLRLFRRPG